MILSLGTVGFVPTYIEHGTFYRHQGGFRGIGSCILFHMSACDARNTGVYRYIVDLCIVGCAPPSVVDHKYRMDKRKK